MSEYHEYNNKNHDCATCVKMEEEEDQNDRQYDTGYKGFYHMIVPNNRINMNEHRKNLEQSQKYGLRGNMFE